MQVVDCSLTAARLESSDLSRLSLLSPEDHKIRDGHRRRAARCTPTTARWLDPTRAIGQLSLA